MMMANARSVNVKRTDLLEKLKANRDKHATEYELALTGYRIEVANQLRDAMAKLTANDKAFDAGFFINEEPPENHTEDYNLAIEMMAMSIDDTIQMDSSSFNQYVMDNWAWKQSFAATTAKYASNVRAG